MGKMVYEPTMLYKSITVYFFSIRVYDAYSIKKAFKRIYNCTFLSCFCGCFFQVKMDRKNQKKNILKWKQLLNEST